MIAKNGLFEMSGVTALITGAGSGLGQAVAHGYANLGANLVLVDRDKDGLSETAEKMEAHSFVTDIADPGSLAELQSELVNLPSVDVLVNAAGIGGRGAAVDYPRDLWDQVLAINLTGTFTMCQIIGAQMIERQRGSIINFASIGGVVGFEGSVGYQASKGGVVQLTRTLAVEWARHGVRVNAIAPSHFETPVVRRQWQSEPQLAEFFLKRTPLERHGQPIDIVGPAIFLATEASAMVTGHILMVDGGYTAQ